MATQYTLKIKNNSTQDGYMCIYQKDPALQAKKDVFSLAWFSMICNQGTQVIFRWTIDYSFVWSQTGKLIPGVYFDASQVKDANPSNPSLSSITLSKPNGGYKFTKSTVSAPEGSLLIHVDKDVPNDEASVGIGMSGQPAFAKNAKTNMDFTFSPHPQYWVVFGDYQEGQVMDFNLSSNSHNIVFPNNVYSKSLVFREDNTFSEMDMLERNEAIRKGKML